MRENGLQSGFKGPSGSDRGALNGTYTAWKLFCHQLPLPDLRLVCIDKHAYILYTDNSNESCSHLL